MNDGVALLLERMKTNPEEFFDFGSKWAGVIGEHKDFLEAEDRQALTDGLNKLMQQRFTEKVMEELVDPKSDNWADSIMRAKGIASGGQTLGHYNTGRGYQALAAVTTGANNTAVGYLAPNSATLTIGNQTIDESHLEHLRAHVDALKREVANQKPKEHKTIFGKLFNYS